MLHLELVLGQPFRTPTKADTIPVDPGPAVVVTVIVTVDDNLIATSETTQAHAVAKDLNGVVIVGRTVSWSSSQPGNATVDSSTGLVTGVMNGNTSIIATIDGVDGSTALTVGSSLPAPPPATHFEVTGPSSLVAGAIGVYTAQLKDASNVDVTTPDVLVTWTKSGSGGTIGGTSTTDSDGKAQISLTASTNSTVVHTVTATASGGITGSLSNIIITPGSAASISIDVSKLNPEAFELINLVAHVLDAFGNGVSGTSLSWSRSPATGTLGTSSNTSGGSGVASNTFIPDQDTTYVITVTGASLSGHTANIVSKPIIVGGSPGHLNEPAGHSLLSPLLDCDTLPPTTDTFVNGSGNDIGWIAGNSAVQKVVDGSSPEGSTNVLRMPFPSGFEGGISPGSVYDRGPGLVNNPQWWELHPRYFYQSMWYYFSPGFPANLVTNKIAYSFIGGGVSAGYIAGVASSDYYLVNGVPELHPFTGTADDAEWVRRQYISPIWAGIDIQGVIRVDGTVGSAFNLTQGEIKGNAVNWKQFIRGRWHHVETLYIANTGENQDGSAKMWFDDELIINFTNRIQWTHGSNYWTSTFWQPVYGGGGRMPSDGIGGYHQIKNYYCSGKAA